MVTSIDYSSWGLKLTKKISCKCTTTQIYTRALKWMLLFQLISVFASLHFPSSQFGLLLDNNTARIAGGVRLCCELCEEHKYVCGVMVNGYRDWKSICSYMKKNYLFTALISESSGCLGHRKQRNWLIIELIIKIKFLKPFWRTIRHFLLTHPHFKVHTLNNISYLALL